MEIIGEYLDRKIQNTDTRRQGPLPGKCENKEGRYERPYDSPAYRLGDAPPMFIPHIFIVFLPNESTP